MTELTIMALPQEDDYVNTISSEKVAHMTVLYLGEVSDEEQIKAIFDFMKHTADMSLPRFGMSVDRRGTLGPEDADVLFFDKSYGRKIEEARGFLLKDDNIRKAYDSVEQYPEWIPHLTLGYPATPAKKDTRDYPGISWVNFDRLALWTGDYEGGVIPLKTDESMAMGAGEFVENFLAHYGKKGMKWGVRKAYKPKGGSKASAPPARPAPKKAASGDASVTVKNKSGRIVKVDTKKSVASTASKMSDEELRSAISRIDMERKYSSLTAAQAPPPSRKRQAAKIVGDVLLDVAKQQAKVALIGVTNTQLQKHGVIPIPTDKKKK